MRRRKWSGARLTRSCAKRAMVVKRKWLRHKENVHRVGARPELVPSVSRTDAPARFLPWLVDLALSFTHGMSVPSCAVAPVRAPCTYAAVLIHYCCSRQLPTVQTGSRPSHWLTSIGGMLVIGWESSAE